MANTPELVEAGLRIVLKYAAQGQTLTYGTLDRELASPFNHGSRIGPLCDDIDALHRARTGLPFMLSALVHNQATGRPGPGFFRLADRLRLLPTDADEQARNRFVDDQVAAIHAHYEDTAHARRAAPADVEIRRARDEEYASVADLRWRWESEQPPGASVEREEFIARFVEWARHNGASHQCFVAVRDQRVIGMAWLAVTARVPTPVSLDRVSGDLQSVYVVPKERGNGVGSRLVEAVIEQARQSRLTRVTVHSSSSAKSLYARHGFQPWPDFLVARPK